MKKWFVIILCGISSVAFSQRLTLEDAIKKTLENNFDIVSASQSAEVARLLNNPGNAGMLPTISLNGNASYGLNALRQEFSNGLTVNNNSVSNRVFGAGASLDWVIFDGLRMFAVKKRLSDQEDQAYLIEKQQMITSVSQVIQVYTALASETQRYQMLQKTVAYFDELVFFAENRLQNGTGNKQEVLQAKTDRNAQRSLLLRQAAAINSLKIQLCVLMNTDPVLSINVDSSIVINRSLVLEESVSNASQNNPAVLIAEKNVSVFKNALREQNSFQMPRISVNLGYNYNYSGSSAGFALFNQTNGLVAGARLAFPIFDGWQVRRNISVAKVQKKTADLSLGFTRRKIESDVRIAFEQYKNLLEVLALEEENILLAEENMNIAAQRYKTGTGTLIESRAAALTYSDAITRYTLAQSETKAAETTLLEISGQLIR
ncbi:MAG: TolC family protein [Flavobacteriales bacterium]|nr:TolC family protein [Flavobacteriales bacterium]